MRIAILVLLIIGTLAANNMRHRSTVGEVHDLSNNVGVTNKEEIEVTMPLTKQQYQLNKASQKTTHAIDQALKHSQQSAFVQLKQDNDVIDNIPFVEETLSEMTFEKPQEVYSNDGGSPDMGTSAEIEEASEAPMNSEENQVNPVDEYYAKEQIITESEDSANITDSVESVNEAESQDSSFTTDSQDSSFTTDSQDSSFAADSQDSSLTTDSQDSSLTTDSQDSSLVADSQDQTSIAESEDLASSADSTSSMETQGSQDSTETTETTETTDSTEVSLIQLGEIDALADVDTSMPLFDEDFKIDEQALQETPLNISNVDNTPQEVQPEMDADLQRETDQMVEALNGDEDLMINEVQLIQVASVADRGFY